VEPWFSKNVRHYIDGPPWLYRGAAHHERALAAVLDEEIAAFHPDLIQIEHEELAGLLARIPRGMPGVLDLHNVLIQVQWQNLGKRATWEWFKACLELGVLARAEGRALKTARHTIAVTQSNVRLLRRLRRAARISLVPNSIDTDYFTRKASRASSPVVVLTGSFHYGPNQEAADLMMRIMPEIRRRCGEAQLRLVGQRIPDRILERARSTAGVTIVGAVDDVRPELESAWVAVAPLARGSGSPLKVLEALAMETPVVGTDLVATSLRIDERQGFVRAGPHEFAAVVASLLTDEPRRRRLAEAGRRAVERLFSRTEAAAALERVWSASLGQ